MTTLLAKQCLGTLDRSRNLYSGWLIVKNTNAGYVLSELAFLEVPAYMQMREKIQAEEPQGLWDRLPTATPPPAGPGGFRNTGSGSLLSRT